MSNLEDLDAEPADGDVTPEAALDGRLKAMYAAMRRPATGTPLPDLDSLPRSGDGARRDDPV